MIPCGGHADRWQNHGGVPKQLADIAGKSVLRRIVDRLLRELPDARVWIVSRDVRFAIDGAVRVDPDPDTLRCDYDKLYCARSRWAKDARTIIVWGDLWLSTGAARTICKGIPITPLWFGRSGPSSFTGKRWRELFAVSFEPRSHELLTRCCEKAADHYHAGSLGKSRPMAWHVYQLAAGQGIAPETHRPGPWLVEIDDWTEDFDSPHDLEDWLCRRRAAGINGGNPWPKGTT